MPPLLACSSLTSVSLSSLPVCTGGSVFAGDWVFSVCWDGWFGRGSGGACPANLLTVVLSDEGNVKGRSEIHNCCHKRSSALKRTQFCHIGAWRLLGLNSRCAPVMASLYAASKASSSKEPSAVLCSCMILATCTKISYWVWYAILISR
ncbi:hypothetical protein N431DRAFT_66212 [Stipitochalara longipes BDJ]|nr:hypothetical protein N431DRAFT_66212 [Stipitochalara longipes BDJ]